MEYINAVFFIMILSGILWKMKADYLLVLFGFAAYLFLLFYIFKYNPTDLLLSIFTSIIFNPYGLLILLVPGVFNYVYKRIKKKNLSKKKNNY